MRARQPHCFNGRAHTFREGGLVVGHGCCLGRVDLARRNGCLAMWEGRCVTTLAGVFLFIDNLKYTTVRDVGHQQIRRNSRQAHKYR